MSDAPEKDHGRYSKVTRAMWSDALFRSLTPAPPNPQTLWFRFLTGTELTNIPGLFPAWDTGLAKALRWPLEGFLKAFGEIASKGMAEADWHEGLVWVPNAIFHNEPANPNIVLSWRTAWGELPECDLKRRAYFELLQYMQARGENWVSAFKRACPEPFAKPFPEGRPIGLLNGLANQDQEQEQEQNQEEPRDVGQEPDSGAGGPAVSTLPEQTSVVAVAAPPPATPPPTVEPPKPTAADRLRRQARFVFETWKLETGKFRAQLDRKRENRIVARLREGFTPDDLVLAIKNRRNDPHLMGETTGVVYAEIDTLLRDRAQVERLIALKERRRPLASRPRDAPRQDSGHDPFVENPRVKVVGGES